jgi:hypothetical protein
MIRFPFQNLAELSRATAQSSICHFRRLSPAALLPAVGLFPALLHADTIIPLTSAWQKWDPASYYGVNGTSIQGPSCDISNKTTTGFTAFMCTNYVDIVDNTTGVKGANSNPEGPQGRPAFFQEFSALDFTHNGQKITVQFNIKFNHTLKDTDGNFRFMLGNTNRNCAMGWFMDSGNANGGFCTVYPDRTMTDQSGFTLVDGPFNSVNNFATATNYIGTNYESASGQTVFADIGYLPGILSHFGGTVGSSGRRGTPGGSGSFGGPNGVGVGFGNLAVTHFIKASLWRTNNGAGLGIKGSILWTNDAGTQVLAGTGGGGPQNDGVMLDPDPDPLVQMRQLSNPAYAGSGPGFDQAGLFGIYFMNNDPYLNGFAGGAFTISNFKIIYESLQVVSTQVNPATDTLTLVWTSTPTDVPNAQYSIQASSDLANWTTIVANIPSQGDFTTNSITPVSTNGPSAFFRVQKQ